MSVTKYVVGVIPMTERVKRLRVIYDACVQMGVKPPVEIARLFEGDGYIEGVGETILLEDTVGYRNDMTWVIVKLSELPEEIDAIAFIEAY